MLDLVIGDDAVERSAFGIDAGKDEASTFTVVDAAPISSTTLRALA